MMSNQTKVFGHKLNKSIGDVAWNQFMQFTTYKAEWAGRTIVKVNPRGTTQVCSDYGKVVPKDLSVRVHTCPHCGLVLDRDLNAAKNIFRLGHSLCFEQEAVYYRCCHYRKDSRQTMLIGGFQKTSLIDYPGHISSIIFTRGCNFRCPYCHNPELVYPDRYGELYNEKEILSYLIGRKEKVNAVVITGGEPTIQRDLRSFIYNLKKEGFLVKLDTNGSRPEILRSLIKEKIVDYFALDIKAPKEKYKIVTRISYSAYDWVIQSKNAILESESPYEFRTVFDPSILTEKDIEEIRKSLPKDANSKVKEKV